MAIKRPDIYEHQNPNEPIADTDFVKGGFRTKVADLTALYALAPKVNQMKEHATSVWVISKAKYYTLVDASNVGNSGGWSDSVLGISAEIQTEDFTADFDKVYNCRGTLTVTNPTGVLNKSYEIRVLGGAVTVGGEVYTVGSVIQVSFNGTTFVYNLLFVLGADTEIIINKFSTLTLADYIALTTDAKTLYFTEEQNATGWQNLRSESNFTALTSETQLTFADGVSDGDASFSLIDLSDAKLKAINEKDYMFYRFQAGVVTPSGSNHWFKILLKVDGVTIAVSPVFNLIESVGVVEQISYHFVVPASASLVTNGAYFYLKASTSITAETPLVGAVRVHKSTNATE
jgi:hypothetical protein